jgi:hypothetical protein
MDNLPLPIEKDGSVTLFNKPLQQVLAGRLGAGLR